MTNDLLTLHSASYLAGSEPGSWDGYDEDLRDVRREM